MSDKNRQDDIEEIKEFTVSSDKTRSERKKNEMASVLAIASWSDEKKKIGAVTLFVILVAAYLAIGILVCKLNPVVVCVIALIQVMMGVLLNQNPVWLHVCVLLADVIVGLFVGQVLLMCMALICYAAAVGTLEVFQLNRGDGV
ncbi:MAG: hypothetical protein PUD20_10195 [bacterium]|nr:hypothetical protein [bacterium]